MNFGLTFMRLFSCSLLLLGCTTKAGDIGSGGESLGESSSGVAGSVSDSDPSATGNDPSASGPGTASNTSAGTTAGVTTSATGDGASTGENPTTSASGTTGTANSCDLDTIRQMASDFAQGETSPADCGVASLADDLNTWAATQECVRQHDDASSAYFGVFELYSDDSAVIVAYAGTEGDTFGRREFYCDRWDPETLRTTECGHVGLRTSDCNLEIGHTCLACHPGIPVDDCSQCDVGYGCVTNVAFTTESFCVIPPSSCGGDPLNCTCGAELCVDPFVSCVDVNESAGFIACECPSC